MTTSLERSEPTPSWVDDFALEQEGVTFQPPRRRWRRWVALLFAAVAVAGVTVWVVNPFGKVAAASLVTGKASTGTIVSSVSLAGSVASSSVNELSFTTSGAVTAVNVAVGDKVTAGQVLATIDDAALKVQLQVAEANLTAAQARLALDQAGPTAATIASAKDSISQAKLQLSTAQTSLGDTEAQNNQSLAQANAALTAATTLLANDTATLPPGDPQLAKDQQAVDSATTNLASAQLKATLSLHQAQSQVNSASLNLTTAQHNYAAKVVPATDAQIASDQAAVAQAQQALATLQATGATITSPIAGTVTAVAIKVGQAVSGTSAAGASASSSSTTGQIEVMDLASLQIAGQASETDIAKLKMGQAATITATALGANTVIGKVCQLSIVGTQISGVTSFGVTVCIDGASTGLLVGMSATAAVVTNRADNAILVPSLAVKTIGGQPVVTVLGADGKTQTNVAVTVGISNGSETQILSGLTGNETVVETIQSTTQTRGGFGGGTRILGGGGFGGG
ncbi:MAG: biotin/lipoyl-binding protein [Chloroflexi bacterium]|nr:biotin/lipoyl-binding protein [Chloroflexota bacterium]